MRREKRKKRREKKKKEKRKKKEKERRRKEKKKKKRKKKETDIRILTIENSLQSMSESKGNSFRQERCEGAIPVLPVERCG